MRILLIVGAMLLALTAVVRGQETGLPLCGEAQLGKVNFYTLDHYALISIGMTKEAIATLSPETFAKMSEAITKENSGETLAEFGKELVAWREIFWKKFPICAEAIEIGLAMAHSATDLAALIAFQLAGIPDADNAYIESVQYGVGSFTLLMSELPDQPAGDYDEAAPTGLPACSDSRLAILSNFLAEYRALLEVPPRTQSPYGVGRYGVAQTAWRAKLWSGLPQCDLSFQLGLLMSRITSDLAVTLALEIAGMAEAAAPFTKQIAEDQARLEELSAPLMSDSGTAALSRGATPPLPECTDEERLGFYAENLAFQGLVKSLRAAESIADILALAEAHLAWREALEANLPGCIESVINAGLAFRVTGNYIAALALDIAGLMSEPGAENPIKPHLFGIVTITVIADEMGKKVEASGREPAELIAAAAPAILPECGDGDIGLDFYNLFIEYSDLEEAANELETVGEYLAYREAQVDWGERHIPNLPRCKQALEAGYIMYTILADYSAAYALIIAGVEVEDIPYAAAIGANRDRLDAWLARELQ